MEAGKIEIWDENELLEEAGKGLGDGVPVKLALFSALSEWLCGCLLDRDTLWQDLHTS